MRSEETAPRARGWTGFDGRVWRPIGPHRPQPHRFRTGGQVLWGHHAFWPLPPRRRCHPAVSCRSFGPGSCWRRSHAGVPLHLAV